jgi:hypothetical protein
MNKEMPVRYKESPILKRLGASIPCFMIVLFTGYVSLFAVNRDLSGDRVLLVLACMGILSLLLQRELLLLRRVLVFFVSVVLLAAIGVFFPTTPFASQTWYFSAVYRLLLSVIIAHAFLDINGSQPRLLRNTGIVLLGLFFIDFLFGLFGIELKQFVASLAGIPDVTIGWNDKYISFWLLFLLWGTVAAVLRSSTGRKNILVILLILISGCMLVDLGSEVALVAWGVSSCAYFIIFYGSGTVGRAFSWAVVALFLLIPALGIVLNATGLFEPESIVTAIYNFNRDTFHFVGSRGIHSIAARLHLFDVGTELMQTNWISGYGFGSELTLPISSNGFTSWKVLPGGHPHNVVFLFCIQMGIFGYFLLCTSVLAIVSSIMETEPDGQIRKTVPAAIALLTGACIIFSTSFAAWKPDMVLLYCMIASMLLMSGSVRPLYAGTTVKQVDKFEMAMVGVAITGIITGLVGYYFF